jgi:septal ring factor EnvC (AmiA/AmiB activator)
MPRKIEIGSNKKILPVTSMNFAMTHKINEHTLFQGENFPGKEVAQLQLLLQGSYEENDQLKKQLGFLAETIRGMPRRDKEEFVMKLLAMNKKILEMDNEISKLRSQNKVLRQRLGEEI